MLDFKEFLILINTNLYFYNYSIRNLRIINLASDIFSLSILIDMKFAIENNLQIKQNDLYESF